MVVKFTDAMSPAAAASNNPASPINVINQQEQVFQSSPFLQGPGESTFQTWYRGVVTPSTNWTFRVVVPEYWTRIVKASMTISLVPVVVPIVGVTISGTLTTGNPNPEWTDNPVLDGAHTAKTDTDDESAHFHKWFTYLADAGAFTNRNGSGYNNALAAQGISIPESNATDLYTLQGSAHHHGMDHVHNQSHTHDIDSSGATPSSGVSDMVESTTPTAVDLYVDTVVVAGGPHNADYTLEVASLLSTSRSPSLPIPGTHTFQFISSRMGEIEVVITWYVVSRPPSGSW